MTATLRNLVITLSYLEGIVTTTTSSGVPHPVGVAPKLSLVPAVAVRRSPRLRSGDGIDTFIEIPQPDLADGEAPSAAATGLYAEFSGALAIDVIERTLATARHVLERSHFLATDAAVQELARDRLRNRSIRPRA